MKKSLVIIPTYNEAENISDMLKSVLSLPHGFHVLVVDDSSPDGTASLVEAFRPQSGGRVFLVSRPQKQGLGPAYVEGFRWALDNNYDYVFEMDADFSHDPKDLERLITPLENNAFDLVIGSRYIKGVNVVNWPMSRVLISYSASLYSRFITGLPVHDPTAGFVGYRSAVIKTILQSPIRFRGYAFQIEMKFKAWKSGYRLKEIPVIFTDRTKGQSKMNASIISEAIVGIVKMKIKSFF